MWSTIAFLGFVVLVAGLLSMIRAIPWLPWLLTRRRAAVAMLGGFVLLMVGAVNDETVVSTVDFTLAAELDDRMLTIGGTADLPDGALIAYRVEHESLATDPDVSLDQALAEGNVAIGDEAYEKAFDLSDWPEGDVRVWVSFQMNLTNAEQPAEIIERFGGGEVGQSVERFTTLRLTRP